MYRDGLYTGWVKVLNWEKERVEKGNAPEHFCSGALDLLVVGVCYRLLMMMFRLLMSRVASPAAIFLPERALIWF